MTKGPLIDKIILKSKSGFHYVFFEDLTSNLEVPNLEKQAKTCGKQRFFKNPTISFEVQFSCQKASKRKLKIDSKTIANQIRKQYQKSIDFLMDFASIMKPKIDKSMKSGPWLDFGPKWPPREPQNLMLIEV